MQWSIIEVNIRAHFLNAETAAYLYGTVPTTLRGTLGLDNSQRLVQYVRRLRNVDCAKHPL
jgi:hypothetical protein